MPAERCGGPCVGLTRRRRIRSSPSSTLSECGWHSFTFGGDDGLEHCSLCRTWRSAPPRAGRRGLDCRSGAVVSACASRMQGRRSSALVWYPPGYMGSLHGLDWVGDPKASTLCARRQVDGTGMLAGGRGLDFALATCCTGIPVSPHARGASSNRRVALRRGGRPASSVAAAAQRPLRPRAAAARLTQRRHSPTAYAGQLGASSALASRRASWR